MKQIDRSRNTGVVVVCAKFISCRGCAKVMDLFLVSRFGFDVMF